MNETQKYQKEKQRYFRKDDNKRRKTDDITNLDVLISMKDASMDDERYRLLKLGFKSSSEITDKLQSMFMSIFRKLKVDEDVIFFKEYFSFDESDRFLPRGNKNPKPK